MLYKYDEKNKRNINEHFNVVKIYEEENSNMDYAVVNLNGEHGSCINSKSTKYWFILEGNATVYLNNEISQVSQGDFIIVNKGIKHNIIGNVKFGVLCIPSYDANFEKFF